jgi:hypothetical protein
VDARHFWTIRAQKSRKWPKIVGLRAVAPLGLDVFVAPTGLHLAACHLHDANWPIDAAAMTLAPANARQVVVAT